MADPISRGSCALWLDASVSSSIHATAGAVDTWDDQSGNGRNATATTTARPTTGTRTFPVSGVNVLDFDGSANTMRTSSFSVTGGTGYTIAGVVLSDNGANGAQEWWAADVTNGEVVGKHTTNGYLVFTGNTVSSGTINTSGHSVINVGGTSSAALIQVDGTVLTSGQNAGTGGIAGGMQIGSSKTSTLFWNGMIAEVVIYTDALSSGDRTSLANYWTTKWFTAPATLGFQPVVPSTAVHRAANW